MAWIHINLKRITLTALFLFSVAIDLLIDLALPELIGGRLAEEWFCVVRVLSLQGGECGTRLAHTYSIFQELYHYNIN